MAGLGLVFVAALALRFWPGEAPEIDAPFEIIAHRGVHQTFSLEGVGNETCTATRIYPLTHEYIENTIPSMQAAFDAGATAVEIDIHHTSDGHVIVFHDWTVDCRTEGHGVTQEQTLAYLKGLDVGYGYTADGGETFPLRGKGVGMMPTLEEVLDRFPDKKFVLNQKSGSLQTVEILAGVLRRYPAAQRARLYYWGPRYEDLKALVPGIGESLMARGQVKRCGLAYLRSLGLGALPSECGVAVFLLPSWGVKYLWGWPGRFMTKVVTAGGRFIPTEVNSVSEAAYFAALPVHGIMTDRIELIGPALRKQLAGIH
jgi:glycerophosphoryl diester phosphodiesterase